MPSDRDLIRKGEAKAAIEAYLPHYTEASPASYRSGVYDGLLIARSALDAVPAADREPGDAMKDARPGER